MWTLVDYTFSFINDDYYLTKVEIRNTGKDKRAMTEITYDLLAGKMETVSYHWNSSVDYITETQVTNRGIKDLINIKDFNAKTVSDQVY